MASINISSPLSDDVDDKTSTRRNNLFIFRVYWSFSFQLLNTFSLIVALVFNEKIRSYLATHIWIVIVSSIMMLLSSITFVCSLSGTSNERNSNNGQERNLKSSFFLVVLFTIFTLATTCTAAGTYARYEILSILYIFGLIGTIMLCFSLISVFFSANWNFQSWTPYLSIALVSFTLLTIFTALICTLSTNSSSCNLVDTLSTWIGIFIFSASMVCNTQRIWRRNSIQNSNSSFDANLESNIFQKDDYLLASMLLYLDFFNIFVFFFKLFGKKEKNTSN